MLNFHGMPARHSTAFVQNPVTMMHEEKRITYVRPASEVIETPVGPLTLNAPPIRTQLVKVYFSDGTSRLGCVTLP